MRALLMASVLMIAMPAFAENGAAVGANGDTSVTGAPSKATTSEPAADPTARSYVNPQTTEAPKNDDNHNPNYQTPAGSKSSEPGGEKATGGDPKRR